MASADVAKALSLEQLWDAMGVGLDGPRAWDTKIVLAWDFTDVGEQWTVSVENGALNAVPGLLAPGADAMVTLTRAAFDAVLLGEGDGPQLLRAAQSRWQATGSSWASFWGCSTKATLPSRSSRPEGQTLIA